MTWMFEVYYLPPSDPAREELLTAIAVRYDGWLDFREAPELDGSHNVCLTYEFSSQELAEVAAQQMRSLGEHVEGPYQYT